MDKNKDVLYKVKDILEDFKRDSSSALKNVNRLLNASESVSGAGDIEDVFQDCLMLWDMHNCLDDVMDDLEAYIREIYIQALTDNGISVYTEFPSIISITYYQKDGEMLLFDLDAADICDSAEKALQNLKSGHSNIPARIKQSELENFLGKVCEVLENAGSRLDNKLMSAFSEEKVLS